jgi:hypothetical protein
MSTGQSCIVVHILFLLLNCHGVPVVFVLQAAEIGSGKTGVSC